MLRDALKKSKNLISARILQEIVKPGVVVNYAKNMGITTNLRAVDALALGTSEVIPLEITSAYGIFPNKGLHVKPIAITKIVDRRGEVIYEEFSESREALSEQTKTAFSEARGRLAKILKEAESYSFERAMLAKATGERFQSQVKAFRAAPEIYKQQQRLAMLEEVLHNVRKYIVVSEKQDAQIYIIDLQEELETDLLNMMKIDE